MFDFDIGFNPATHVLVLVKLIGLDDRSGGFFRHPQQVHLIDYEAARHRLEQSMKNWDDECDRSRFVYDTEVNGIKCHVLIQEFENWYYFQIPMDQTLEFLKFNQIHDSQDWTITPSDDQISGIYVHPDEANDPENCDWQEYIRFTAYFRTPIVKPYDYS